MALWKSYDFPSVSEIILPHMERYLWESKHEKTKSNNTAYMRWHLPNVNVVLRAWLAKVKVLKDTNVKMGL